MTAATEYFELALRQIAALQETQGPAIEKAAGWIAEALGAEHRVWVAATSHVLHTELVLRAGGLVAVHQLGSAPDLAKPMYGVEMAASLGDGEFQPEPGDVAIIGTNAGTDAGTVEVALAAQRAGCRLVALTCLAYEVHPDVVVEHASGRKLIDFADLVIDLGCPVGDAGLEIPGLDVAFGPTSGLTLVASTWAMLARASELLAERGLRPLVYRSVQLPGGEAEFAAKKAAYESSRSGVVDLAD
jgi:uncharacterized phosphosugar-binding protein